MMTLYCRKYTGKYDDLGLLPYNMGPTNKYNNKYYLNFTVYNLL